MSDNNFADDAAPFTSTVYDDDMLVEEWMGPEMSKEANSFKKHGYEKTSFISGMTEPEIKELGIRKKGTINALQRRIEQLKDYEIPTDVPDNIESWLQSLDLLQYKDNFIRNQISTQKEMEILKDYTVKDIKKELGIKKFGHIKRLLKGISKLRKPTKAEQKMARIQKLIVEKKKTVDVSSDAYIFWKTLTERCLTPKSAVFESDNHLKAKLAELRNRWLAIFVLINVLWLILIATLAHHGEILGVFGSNPVGFCVIVLYGSVLVVQFFAMIIHRISNLMHVLGRTPYKCNSKYNNSWMFDASDSSAFEETLRPDAPIDVEQVQRPVNWPRQNNGDSDNERTPLLKTS